MKNKKLNFYLFFCIFIFFTLLIVVLLYSFGYKYNIKEREAVRTGAIVIKSVPEDANVYINDKIFKNSRGLGSLLNNHVKIENLNSGIYNVKLKKDGYFSWEKNIIVNSGYITELKSVVLLKNNYEKMWLLNNIETEQKRKSVWFDNSKNKIVYKNKNKLLLFDINSAEVKIAKIVADFNNPVFKKINAASGSFVLVDVIWSDDDNKIIAKIKEKNTFCWYLIDFTDNKIYDLSYIFNEISEPRNKYNFDFKETLFYIKNGSLYKFDYKKSISKRILAGISGFLVHGNSIYYFQKDNNTLYVDNLDKIEKSDLTQAKSISFMPENFDNQLPARIIKSSDNAYLILSWSGKLYFINKMNEISFINHQVKNTYFSNNNERIVYYNSHEIWIYYIEEKISQPTKKKSTNELITRYSGDISNIALYADEEHLFYKEGDIFKFAELDNRDRVNVFDFLTLTTNDILYSREKNSIYYAEDGKFLEIRLAKE